MLSAAAVRLTGSGLGCSDWPKCYGKDRIGDHRWWISDLRPFAHDYPGWKLTRSLQDILRELHDENAERWLAGY